jgi:serine/threonine protein kinase/Tol biopolymer transport system component
VTPERWQEVKKVLAGALEQAPGERDAYVDKACAGDVSLRQEVDSLLAQQKTAGSFLETPALEVAGKAQAEDRRQSSLVGQQLGSYKIVSLLGSGGMGEVYQAHDTKLGRDVAIKVLPPDVVHDADRLARFQREARMLASLNHPNIAMIYGLEQSGDVRYLVMELVAGQTLAERVSGGELKIKESLNVAAQIAQAIEAAHERGVIHRDLKPANVKVTPAGRVKVLDFGLAKAYTGDGEQDLSNSATLTTLATEEGIILGTPAYMSPEQARGKAVDKRTDIWAFGCVLYEMLAGKRAFGGQTIPDTIAAVLECEPGWHELPPATPAKIGDLLRRCLQKDSQRRLRDIGDARIEIEEALAAPAMAEPAAATKSIRATWQGALPWGLAFLLLVAVSSIFILNRKSSSPTSSVRISRIAITLPPTQPLAGLELGSAVALSPDGTRLVYAAHQGGGQQLYLRPLEDLEAQPIPGTAGAVQPFFSPDGKWLGFFADGKLKKIPVNGGEAVSLGDAVDPRGASWGSQGLIVFAPTRESALQKISDAGGISQPVTRIGKEPETSHRWPEFLPSGEAVLFAAFHGGGNWNNAQISVQSVGSGERRDLVQGGTHPRYAPSGHLVYAQGGTLMAAPFDAQSLMVTGAPVPVQEGVLQSTFSGAAQYSFSSTGSLVYVPASVQATQRRLVWVSRSGAEQPLAAPARAYRGPRLSPDGRDVAVAVEGQETEVWLYNLSRDTFTRLTFQGSTNYNPIWTRDGKRLVFTSLGHGLTWQAADGSGGPEVLSGPGGYPSSWSPDGKVLAVDNNTPSTGRDILMLRLGDRKEDLFLGTPFNEGAAQFSPDGRWLAYVSNESGRYEIYVQPYPGPGGKLQISTDGGGEQLWNPNGRELFYRSGDKMMAVDITTQPSFSAGKPKVLFAGQYQPSPNPVPNVNYDVSPDGQRFLMVKPGGQDQATTQVNVVLNWFEELKQKVPTGKK